MPQPTGTQMHQNQPLQDMTVGNTQDDLNFLLMQCGPVQPVDKKSNTYYVYTDADWNRMEMAPRGSSEESHGSGWTLSTDSYSCDRWAVHKDFDWDDEANADEAVANTDADAAEWLANQARIRGDYLLGSEVFAASVWTTDLDGTTGSPSAGTTFKRWDESTGDPQGDIVYYSEVVNGLVGRKPNVGIFGAKTWARMLVNTNVRSSLHASDLLGPQAIQNQMAAYLGLEKCLVAGAYYNTAAEGATATLSYILDSKSAWIGYVNPEVGLRKISAFRLFGYKHGGMASNGIITRSFDMEELTSTRHEVEVFWDVKVISAGCGCFFDDAVSS